ncbi:LysR substrate-binding domain-containing protein [Cupriavidus sp. YAF13]|uniref:LysR substrate-binding domain-containing protein n=1 Tax=Cupriavidus sp. YAF13 TaxID=3233075 RepID=UPI003F8ED7F3
MMPGMSSALDHVRQAVGQSVAFDPAAPAGRSFTIAATDYAAIVLLPYVISRLRRQAPDIGLRIMALDRAAIYEQLDQGVVDVAIGGHLSAPKLMVQTKLYEEDFVCIASRSHPQLGTRGRRRSIDLATYLQLPHAAVWPRRQWIAARGRRRQAGQARRATACRGDVLAHRGIAAGGGVQRPGGVRCQAGGAPAGLPRRPDP